MNFMEFPSEKIAKKELEIKPGLEERLSAIPVETRPELVIEKKEIIDEGGGTPKTKPKTFIFKKGRKEEAIHLTKSETLKQIEEILVEGLDSYYQSLPEALKVQFKRKGEETASKIEKIIESARIVVKKIFNLIFLWLKTVSYTHLTLPTNREV